MKETIQVYSLFVWALLCALLGLSCEYVSQALIYSGHWLQRQAGRFNDYAEDVLGIGIDD